MNIQILGKEKRINLKLAAQYTLLGVFGWTLTAYIFLSSYELVFNRPIPLLNSVGTMQSTTIINDLIKNKLYYDYSPGFEVLDKNAVFQDMRIPRLDITLNLVSAIKNNGQWIYRGNSGQYFFLSDRKTSNPNYIVIYANQNWRSIVAPQDIIVGDNLFLENNTQTTSLFRITDKRVLPYGTDYIPSDEGQVNLVLDVEDTSQHVEYVFEAVNVVTTSSNAI